MAGSAQYLPGKTYQVNLPALPAIPATPDELVTQANTVPQKYAAAYTEFEALVEVFRAYVIAVRLRGQQPGTCSQLPRGLLQSEKTSSSLPEYHPTDLAMAIG